MQEQTNSIAKLKKEGNIQTQARLCGVRHTKERKWKKIQRHITENSRSR